MKYSNEENWVIMNTTQTNYANGLKRLTRRMKFSNFILIYYSIILIIFSLTSKYYGDYVNKNFLEFIGIIISVVMLTFSIINSNANYQIRIDKFRSSMDQVKELKRKLGKEDGINDKYNKITSQTEVRNEVDFYVTVRNLIKELNEKKDKGKELAIKCDEDNGLDNKVIDEIKQEKVDKYKNDINDLWLQRIIYYGEYVIYGSLVLAPIIIVGIGIYTV